MSKLRINESQSLALVYEKLMQILHNIVESMEENNVESLDALPPSVLPTSWLYEIALGYDLMYTQLMEKELLAAGAHKQNEQLH